MFDFSRLATFNARSLNKRYIEINKFLKEFKIDILAIQETWYNKNINIVIAESGIPPPGEYKYSAADYNSHRRDRNIAHRGM